MKTNITYTVDPKTLEERNFWYPSMGYETAHFTDHPISTHHVGSTPITAVNPAAATGPVLVQEPKQAIKYDDSKTDWSLMPFEAVEEINKVLEFGAVKYSAHNWKQGEGFKYTRILNSLLRHIFAYIRGEDRDPESGLSHLAHAGCNVIFLLYYERYKKRYSNDDRVQ